MRKVQLQELQEKSKDEIIKDLRNRKYSLLDSIGCKWTRLLRIIPGIAAMIAVKYVIFRAKMRNKKDWHIASKSIIVSFLRYWTPYTIDREDRIPITGSGLILGFNHPSLGEILRLIAFVAKNYPYKNYLFPVTLAWYEVLIPVVKPLEEIGYTITPIITPSARKALLKGCSEEERKTIELIGTKFNKVYLNLCVKFSLTHNIILVAPSATRQRTIFRTDEELNKLEKIEPSTMSLLALTLSREKYVNVRFIPIAVKPPRGFSKGLNLKKSYCFGFSEPFTIEEAIKLSKQRYGNFKGHLFDYEFLARITRKMFILDNNLIAPLEDKAALDGLENILENKKGP